MASIKLSIDVTSLTVGLRNKLNKLKDKEYLLRPVCFDLIDLMTKRIHVDGLKTNGSPMGTYTATYLQRRQKHFKRTADTKVIISLTRQLENDWSVIATTNGYGIGFKNYFNFQKSQWVEVIYGRIFGLTNSERQYATKAFNILIKKALQGG